jgi:tRNA/tmRNA/rRNA uracil-C5-methylase (TrmA/RlmC/RlmD family)
MAGLGAALRSLDMTSPGRPEVAEVARGDELELLVGEVATGGGCVARAPDGRVVFVRHTVPGERVRARVTETNRSYLRADAVTIVAASPDRVEPPCPSAGPGRCGGCDYQHIELGAQRRLKATRVEEQLARVAGLERQVVVEAVAGDTDGLGWRSRVRVAVDRGGRVGFRRHRSHQLERIDRCPVATMAVEATGALTASWPGASELEVVTGTSSGGRDESFVVVTPHGRATPRVPALAPGVGLVLRRRVERRPGAVHVAVRDHVFRVTAGVFWQVHAGAAEALLDAVLDAAGARPGEHVVDLYAGAGLFSVPLAAAVGPDGSVLAVERDPAACADARQNGASQPALRVQQAAVTPELVATQIGTPRVVVLDPARQGAGIDVTRALAERHAATLRLLVYVACDPASFARDAGVLTGAGWRLDSLRAFDIFPMTEHVELVATFTPPA